MGFLFGAKKININNTETAVGAVRVQNSAQGVPIPIVYGTTRITGNNLWYGDFTAVPHTDTQSSGGGKGGGGGVTTTTTTYTYTVGIAIGLCEGPITGVGQIWEQKNITDEAKLGLTEFTGSYSQAAWSFLTSNHPGDAFAYRGTAYEATAAYNLGSSSSLPNLSFEVNGFKPDAYVGWGGALDPAATTAGFVLSGGDLTLSGFALGLSKGSAFRAAGNAYVEFTINTMVNEIELGITNAAQSIVAPVTLGGSVNSYAYASSGSGIAGIKFHNSVPQAYGSPFITGDVISMLWDGDALIFWKNGISQGTAYTGVTGSWACAIGVHSGSSASVTINTGATAFVYTLPGSTSTDVNPAGVLGSLLTNANYGAVFPSAQFGSMTAFSTYCAAAGILISPAYVAQRSAMDICTELCQIGISAPFWSEGLLKVTPYADTAVGAFTPVTTVQYQLADDDFLTDPPVLVKRKRPADAFNAVQIQVCDRSNDYNPYVAEAKDQASIDLYGLRPQEVVTLDAICQAAIGRTVAQAMLQRVLYYLNTYEFTLGWKYSRLEPMDLVGITDAGCGLSAATVRVLSVEEDTDGNLRIIAEDFNPGVSNASTYGTQAGSGYIVNQDVDPGDANAPVVFQPSIALTGTPQAYLGTSGGANWGGAELWLSSDNVTYTKFGTITAPARHGVLSAPLPSHADPDTVNALSVDLTLSAGDLITVPIAQADALVTLCYVDGELIAYETAALTSAFHYDLTYLRRGNYWTPAAAHLAGTKFMRLDAAVITIDVSPTWPGTTIYIKLLSFNKTGGGLQSLADVVAIAYAVQNVDMVISGGIIPGTIPAGQRLYIPAGTTMTVPGGITIYGELAAFGELIIT